jgi:hypothetical protein
MAAETWSWCESVILEVAVTAQAQGRDLAQAIADDSGLEEADRVRGIAALVEDGYLTGPENTSYADVAAGMKVFVVQGVTGKARRATRQWPAERAYDDLIDQLEQRIAATSDDAKRSKLQAILGSVREVGQDIVTDVIAKVIEHQGGMS